MESLLYLVLLLVLALAFALPLFLTGRNVWRLLGNYPTPGRVVYDLLVFGLGLPLTFVTLSDQHWSKPVRAGMELFHAPIEFDTTIVVVLISSTLCFWVLRLAHKRLPPLPKALCFVGIYVGCIYALLWIVQLSEHFVYPSGGWGGSFDEEVLGVHLFVFFDMLYAVNYLLLSAQWVKQYARCPTVWPVYRSKLLNLCGRFFAWGQSIPLVALLLLLPLAGIVLVILILFGQSADVLIGALTNTSDWFFSTKISPPPLEHTGHYLCTVAAQGDRKVVKPLRWGVQHGAPVVVNRQLCVANAFEDLIAERFPRLHRMVRRNYDRYGYPICRYINRPWKANAIYWLMKPAEWLFLTTLYTMDTKPEERINRQYR